MGLFSAFGFCAEIRLASNRDESDVIVYCYQIPLEGENGVEFGKVLIGHVLAFVRSHNTPYRQWIERDRTENGLPSRDHERVGGMVDYKDIASAIYGGWSNVKHVCRRTPAQIAQPLEANTSAPVASIKSAIHSHRHSSETILKRSSSSSSTGNGLQGGEC